MIRVGSLCSGYGGLEMATLAVLGGTVAWHADNDPAATRVLEHHWSGVPNYGDITVADWATAEPVDVITAGYPCQPDSAAGKRRGIDDERWIWPAVRDAIRDLGPRLVVLENVRGHLGRGFPTVVGDLAGIGYDTRWCCLPASAVGAPHRRERLFAVARPTTHPHGDGQPRRQEPHLRPGPRIDPPRRPVPDRLRLAAAHASGAAGGTVRWGRWAPAIERWERLTRPAPDPVERGRRGNQRLNSAFSEWMMGLPAGWVTAVPGLSRNDELRLIGNGVVPQQAVVALRWLLNLDQRAGAA